LVPGTPVGDPLACPSPRPGGPDDCRAPEPAPLPDETLVALSGVGYVYAAGTPWARRALSSITLEIARGEVVAVVGPNAAGKSTLAWLLAGLLEPTEGQATMEGEPLPARLGQVGMAFQHARLQLFRSSVEGDLTSGTDLDRAGAAAALARVGLPTELLDRRIDALSGGEQRRVALAGMLARRPSLLVLDEPLAGLDAAGRRALAEVLAQLRASRDTAVVLISHDVGFASRLADRTLRMEGGRLVEPGGQEHRPADGPEGAPPRPAARARGRRRRAQPQLFRYVPGDSPIHRLWAGTKLLSVVAFSVAASVHPSWPSEAVLGAILALWMAVSRVGPRALPRPPAWLAGGLALGAALALLSGGGAAVRVGGLRIGLSGLNQWAEFTCLILLLVMASLLVGLTTPVADVSPALSRLLSPLRRARLPADELVAGVALCVRCLTLLGEELRVLSAARRVRRPLRPRRRGLLELLDDGIDLLVTALVVAVRRAGELSFAIEARGGLPEQVPKGPAPGRRDAVALAVAAAAAVVMALV
jgi:energy-coupling factor transporter ATP-binding protein EcfA2